jgi:hypothetical protein
LVEFSGELSQVALYCLWFAYHPAGTMDLFAFECGDMARYEPPLEYRKNKTGMVPLGRYRAFESPGYF